MDKEDYFNILDFGSSKIRFSVYDKELRENYTETKIVKLEDNYVNHLNEFNKIIKKAEKNNSTQIKDIVLSFDTKELFSVDFSLDKDLNANMKINKLYESLILEASKIINYYYGQYKIIHIILDKCIIDKKIYSELPKEKSEINNIKVDLKFICYPKKIIENIKKIFNKNNINILNFFCTSYVKSLSYLKKLNNENISFIEIGFDKTCFITFKKNKLKIIQTIPIGGANITKDISKIFKISFNESEQIKKLFNKSETEFSYEDQNNMEDNFSIKEILKKNISIDLLKKVILYRVQEIIDLTFEKSSLTKHKTHLKYSDLFFIGEGSILFNNNYFHLNDKFEFRSLNYYEETDSHVCNSILNYYLNNNRTIKTTTKKQGLFEKFFNFFGK